MSAPNLFQYFEYRKFLSDFIAYKKNFNRKYSYRYYSSKAGFSSTNFISLVIKNKRNLTADSIGKLAKGLKLNKQERSYFEDLVFMNQAKRHDEKDYYYQRMLRSKPFKKIRLLSKSSYDYFGNWYNPVIREFIEMVPAPIDPMMIAASIVPPLKPSQVKSAIRLLLNLNLIEENADGSFRKTDTLLTTGDEIQSLQIVNFHRAMLKLATRAVTEFPPAERDISGLVLSINNRNMAKIKEKIAAFRREMAELASAETQENQVIYVQINSFPLMRPYGDTRKDGPS